MDLMSIRRGLIGAMASNVSMVLLDNFAVPESWENDTLGNAKKIYTDYIEPAIQSCEDGVPIYVKTIGNNATNYRFLNLMFYKGTLVSDANALGLRLIPATNTLQVRNSVQSSVSLWCSAGTVIEIYKITV